MLTWIRKSLYHMAQATVGPQPQRPIVATHGPSDTARMRARLLGQGHELLVNQEGVAEDFSFSIKSLDLYDNGFMIRSTLTLYELRTPLQAGRRAPVSEHPEPLLAVTDDRGRYYEAWLHSASGAGRSWDIVTCCTPSLDGQASELRLVVPEMLWEKVEYRDGHRTVVDRQAGCGGFVVDLSGSKQPALQL